MKQVTKKFISVLLVIELFVLSVVPAVQAEDIPSAPATPENTTVVPTAPPVPENTVVSPTQPATPSLSPSPSAPTASPTPTPASVDQHSNDTTHGDSVEEGDSTRTKSKTSAFVQGVNATPTPTPSQSGKVGDSEISTGDSTNSATAQAAGNNNLAASAPSASVGESSGAQVVNSGNGSNSNNNGSATVANDNSMTQNNTANVNNSLAQSSTTGNNETSDNVGNASIVTGDANVTGTVITAVNTNVDGVMVSEFNIADDHVGDVVLDFAANCVSGCGGGPVKVANTGNGSSSDNNASYDETNNNGTFQNNDATIGSELVLSADSGKNTASRNTGGDSNIDTGDANVSANAITFANNNIAGNVVYAVVNIFGDLIGDILFPESAITSCCGKGSVTAANVGNGSNSDNNANIDLTNNNNTFQTNDADISNTLVFDAQTGNNESSANTGGDSAITSGNTKVDANVLNVVNSNLIGGNMWLVIVNEAGKWIGKILGAPDGSNFAGSQGTEFQVDQNGVITASNNGNGSNSNNDANISQTNNNATVQNNNAAISNLLNLSANTGGNASSDNTGGNSKITTGDANIVANLVNFVNNNISGNGKLFVTVVNVFGSWLGDFVSPGQHKQDKPAQNQNTQQAVGGTNNTASAAPVETQHLVTLLASDVVTPTPSGVISLITHISPITPATTNVGSTTQHQVAGTQTSLVKGSSAFNPNKFLTESTEGKIKVNLAWLVLVLPLFAVGFGVKRFVLPKLSRSM